MIKISKERIDSTEYFINIKNIHENEVRIVWLGQAGFALKFKDKLLIIDPYLSDYLSKKYKEKIFPHIRLMKIPLKPDKITNLDYYLSTHAHSDHMDPETLSILSNNNPNCKVIVPAAEVEEAINRGAKRHQIIPINDGERINLDKDLNIIGVGASHEFIKVNNKGEYHFLGYVFDIGGIKIYHSGDCIPYKGLYEKLAYLKIDLALLPINGRDEFRLNHGIAGNFKISEVLDLCQEGGIINLLVHHFGMFAYNTVSYDELEQLKKKSSRSLRIIVPEVNAVYKLRK